MTHRDGGKRRDEGFSDATLAADHGHDVFDAAKLVRVDLQAPKLTNERLSFTILLYSFIAEKAEAFVDTDNVYRRIEIFYQRRKELNKIVRKQRMERYFRELAWQGKSDLMLRRIFGVVSSMLRYMLRQKLYFFSLLTRYDYIEIFYQYASARPKLRLIEKNAFSRYPNGRNTTPFAIPWSTRKKSTKTR